ncbi:CaiB/BaiF CoA transferase family protein [Sphingomonas sp.]|uniref:CaiB/BaiF CoA transferase family protein n=1 Tax=Sphingomonas sp. TaxID=28214 RepID=UPI002DD6661B|nr:CaiB/BaiF CoA-transferase family protein [Sphingomonas sp.]
MPGALDGIRIIEFAGIGPGPFAGMMLADHGAEVIRIDRPGTPPAPHDVLSRSRRSIAIDLKQPAGVALVRRLCAEADGLIEGYRPGVMERLRLGPDVLLGDNPKLVYGRMTGWGQSGPLAQAAGHDINYIAISGVLHTIGTAGGKPVPPVNYVGDFAGGGMMLAYGMLAALLNVARGGGGQVIDAAMTDGSALIAAILWRLKAEGRWADRPGVNLIDGGAHFYDSYVCADGRFVAVGAIEPQFYAELRAVAGVADDPAFDAQFDPRTWGALKEKLAAIFATRPRDEWVAAFAGRDACFAPVLSLDEAAAHPHNVSRGTYLEVDGLRQPAPAPRLSTTPAADPAAPVTPGADTDAVLAALGVAADEVAALRRDGTIG